MGNWKQREMSIMNVCYLALWVIWKCLNSVFKVNVPKRQFACQYWTIRSSRPEEKVVWKCAANLVEQSNFTEISFQPGCSSVELQQVFKTSFHKNFSERLFLNKGIWQIICLVLYGDIFWNFENWIFLIVYILIKKLIPFKAVNKKYSQENTVWISRNLIYISKTIWRKKIAPCYGSYEKRIQTIHMEQNGCLLCSNCTNKKEQI